MNNDEIIKTFYSDECILIPKPFYRFHKNGNRYYYNSEIQPKIGITSFLSKTLPTPYFLKEWQKQQDNFGDTILRERAEYGTIFHEYAANIIRDYTITDTVNFDFDNLFFELNTKLNPTYSISKIYDFVDELKSDLLSFIQFVIDSDMRAQLIEAPLSSKTMQLAATLDYFGNLTTEIKGFWGETYKTGANAGQQKETKKNQSVKAIIDFKTKRKKDLSDDSNDTEKAISLSNKLQLNFQLLFLRENYPQFKDTEIKLFNLIPKSWITNPDIQLTEIDIIDERILRNFYEFTTICFPELFDIQNKKAVTISGKFINSINDVLKVETVESYLINQLKINFNE